jgi:undecaprenyl-diphosphatase
VRRALARLDSRVLRVLRTRLHAPVLERVAVAYTTLGEAGAVWTAAALAGAALDSDRRASWLGAAALVPATLGANYLVKHAVRRERPRLRGLPPIGHVPRSYSFPSAHAATSFAGAEAIGALAPSLRARARGVAFLMALTRPYLGLHHPSDALFGALFGSALGRAAAATFPR